MDRTDDDVDGEHLGICGFTEGINLVHIILAWFDFNKLHWITSDFINHDIGANLWDTGSFGVNLSEGLKKMEGGIIGGI